MARIPLGNFGNAIADPAPSVRIPAGAFDTGGAGLQKLGDTAINVGAAMADEKHQQDVALQRARAANAVLDRDIAVKTEQAKISAELEAGTLHYTQAQETFRKRVQALPLPPIQGLDAVTAENLQRGVKRHDQIGDVGVTALADKYRVTEFKSQADLAIDKLGKLAGMPGADVDAVTKQIGSLDPLGRVAYGKNWESKKQEFTDKVWFNEANAKAIQARDNLDALKALESDLTKPDGFYAGKLDTEKRNMVMRSVISQRSTLETRMANAENKIEAQADRKVKEVQRQIEAGVPLTPSMWNDTAQATRGTSFEGEVSRLMDEESAVQRVLRMKPAEQKAYVEQKQAALLTGGGTMRDKANLDRLSRVIEANTKDMKDAYLVYHQRRTGEVVQPIDIPSLMTPDGGAKVGTILRDRVNIIGAGRKENGAEVQMRPFLPYEAQALTAFLNEAQPAQQVQAFGALRKAFADDDAYIGAMQQIAPDSPVRARAGQIMAMQRKITMEKNTFFADVAGASGDVATTILVGESILNPSSKQKSENGAGRHPAIPEETLLRSTFETTMGKDIYAGRAQDLERDYKTFKAYYVGAAVQRGIIQKDADARLMKEAQMAAVGQVETFNGKSLLLPPGFDKSKLHDEALKAITEATRGAGRPESAEVLYRNSTLTQLPGTDGVYMLTQGRNFVPDKTGRPMIIRLGQP